MVRLVLSLSAFALVTAVLFQNCTGKNITYKNLQQNNDLNLNNNTPPNNNPPNNNPPNNNPPNNNPPNNNPPATGSSLSCSDWKTKNPDWLFCEDFEYGNGNFNTWLDNSDFNTGLGIDDRGRIRLSTTNPFAGNYSILYPGEKSSGNKGATLDWRHCQGEQVHGNDCTPLVGHEQLYFRTMVKFDINHKHARHFLNIGGSQPDRYWYHGTAGCRPNGIDSIGATVDFKTNTHESFFYTYTPDMGCERATDSNPTSFWKYNTRSEYEYDRDNPNGHCKQCESKGFPTCGSNDVTFCWGNHYKLPTKNYLPVGKWFCYEMMVKANTISGGKGNSDGVMAYWVDGQLVQSENSMYFRKDPNLKLNRVRLQHYLQGDDVAKLNGANDNKVWFDNVVVSKSRIGCQ